MVIRSKWKTLFRHVWRNRHRQRGPLSSVRNLVKLYKINLCLSNLTFEFIIFMFDRKLTKAMEEQLHKLWHVTNIYLHPNLYEYAQKLTSKMPRDLKVF